MNQVIAVSCGLPNEQSLTQPYHIRESDSCEVSSGFGTDCWFFLSDTTHLKTENNDMYE